MVFSFSVLRSDERGGLGGGRNLPLGLVEVWSEEVAQAWTVSININDKSTLRIFMKQPFPLVVLPCGWQEIALITDSKKWFKSFVIS
jgi:hypothetical protein